MDAEPKSHNPGSGSITSRPAPDRLARALPQHVARTISALRDAGYETVVVGGGVRDALLGRPVLGFWDLATAAAPDAVVRLFPDAVPTGMVHGTVTLPRQ